LINILVLVVVAILMGLAKLAERAVRKAAERQAEEKKLRSQDAAHQEAPADEQEQPAPPARHYPHMPTTDAQIRRTGPPDEPVDFEPPPAARPTAPRQPRPVRLAPVEAPTQRVSTRPVPSKAVEREIQRLQARLRKLESVRLHRLETRIPPEARASAIERRILSLQPSADERPVQQRAGIGVRAGLTNTEIARMAIVYHEIFSLPKALRSEREMWDT